MLITTKKKPRPRPDYEGQIRRHRAPIDPWRYPPGGIGGLGDIGIPAIDAVIAQTETKLDGLILALQVGAVLSAIGAATGLILIVRDRRAGR